MRDRVFVGSRTYDLIALDAANGKELWKHYYWFSWIESPPVVRDGVVYTGSSDGVGVFAIDARDGKLALESEGAGLGVAAYRSRRAARRRGDGRAAVLIRARAPARSSAIDRASGAIRWMYLEPPSATTLEKKAEWGFAAAPRVGRWRCLRSRPAGPRPRHRVRSTHLQRLIAAQCRWPDHRAGPRGSRTVQLSAALVIFVATIAISLIGLYGSPKLIDRSLFRPYWFLRRKRVRHRHHERLRACGSHAPDLQHDDVLLLRVSRSSATSARCSSSLLYLAGLLISHAGTYYKQRNNPEYACLGASGAISAVLFAAIVYFPEQSLFIMPIPIPIPAPLFAVLLPRVHVLRVEASARTHQSRCAPRRRDHGLAFVAVTEPRAYGHLLQSIF